MSEKALIKMRDGGSHVRLAQPYADFWTKVVGIPGPFGDIECIYCSVELEKAIRKRWSDLGVAPGNEQCVLLKGLGDLPLERAAALHARLDIGLDTPHVRGVDRLNGDPNVYPCG